MRRLFRDLARQVTLEAPIVGDNPRVVLLASALRGAADFARLQDDLREAGISSLAVNMRGVGESCGPADPTLEDIADDIAWVIDAGCGGSAHVIGHALGNILARATASIHPGRVRSVVAMPCGGHNLGAHPVPLTVLEHFVRCHDLSLPEEERRESLQAAFFAPGNDPSAWLDGWWPAAGAASAAARAADPEKWWRAGVAPMLIIQPMQDAMAAPAVGREAAAAIGQRAVYLEVERCGHAILPEQPETIATHCITFLGGLPS